MELNDFLTWLYSSGGAVMAASFILEQIPAWLNWDNPQGKKWSFFGLAAVIGCGALGIVQYASAEFIALVSPFFAVVAASFASIMLGSAFHKLTKN